MYIIITVCRIFTFCLHMCIAIVISECVSLSTHRLDVAFLGGLDEGGACG